jgi:hypothetical protein
MKRTAKESLMKKMKKRFCVFAALVSVLWELS